MRKRSFLRVVSFSLFVFMSLAVIPAFGQGATGSISGEVKDDEGAALPGVLVTVSGDKGVRSVTTDEDGKYKIDNLVPGLYDIKVELSGFVTLEQTDIKVEAGAVATPFTMRPSSLQELMVVTASKVETPLINAPATISVLTSDAIQAAPAQNYGDLLRSVPGVNVIQMSARDINLTSRQSTSTLATSQLALLDGRTIYQDFFGLILWDLLPVNFNEVKQVEVIRGPASAVWGANAQTGVVNIITKSPREMAGTNLTFTAGFFNRAVESADGVFKQDEGNGTSYGINLTHAQVLNDKWSFKLSGGYFDTEQYARPIGFIPKDTVPNTDVPTGGYPYAAVAYQNQGSQQPKFDIRFDQELGRDSKLIYAAGVAGTSGIIQTGIGPFDIQNGTTLTYGKVNYSHGNFKLNFFGNFLDGKGPNLLTRGTDGQPLEFVFKTQTYDWEVGHSLMLGGNHMLSFGGNFRRNNFDLSIAPNGTNRNEVGGYIQDEIFTQHFRFVIGGRLDKFSVIKDPVFSPRLTFMYKPTPDHSFRASFNQAFRSPSLINNFLDTTIISAVLPVPPSPYFPTGQFPIFSDALGNEDLKQESLTAYEVGYTGQFGNTNIGVSYYINNTNDNINFTPNRFYSAFPVAGTPFVGPPPNWQYTGIPPEYVFFNPATGKGVILPAQYTYLNMGPVRYQGIELSWDQVINDKMNFTVNYSWQKEPEILKNDNGPDFPASELIFAPKNRFNAVFNYNDRRYLGSFSVNYASSAFWTDVLDSRFWGPTDPYTLVNCSFGVRWMNAHLTTSIKINNLLNQQVQQHVFGDIIKRSVVGEVNVNF